MAENQQTGEKTEDATPKRKQDSRKKGQVAKSTDLVHAATLLAGSFMLPWLCEAWIKMLIETFRGKGLVGGGELTPETAIKHMVNIGLPSVGLAGILILLLLVVGVAANLGQVGLLWATEPIKPTFQKINPLEGFKRLVSKKALFEGFKAIFKLTVFSWIVYAAVSGAWNELVYLSGMPPAKASAVIGGLIHTIMTRIALVWMVLAALDYFFQFKQHEKQIKMTKQELKQEMKEQEGSPEVKMARMQRRRKLSKGSLKSMVAEADVIITNPTHFAVAIKYERSKMHAPLVVAKGQDYLALKIRALAKELDVPIVENKPLARGLYAQCDVGDYVPREHFGAVAEVLAYVYKTLKKLKKAA